MPRPIPQAVRGSRVGPRGMLDVGRLTMDVGSLTSVPPHVAVGEFQAAIAEWRSVVGPRWVFTAAEDLDLYRDAYSPLRGEPEERVASAALAPASLEEVRAIVRIAHRRRIPL